MKLIIPIVMTIHLCTFFVGAESESLKGTVKKTGGTTGIPGVKVSLIKLSTLSTTTGTDGAFTLTSPSSIKLQNGVMRWMLIWERSISFAPSAAPCPIPICFA